MVRPNKRYDVSFHFPCLCSWAIIAPAALISKYLWPELGCLELFLPPASCLPSCYLLVARLLLAFIPCAGQQQPQGHRGVCLCSTPLILHSLTVSFQGICWKGNKTIAFNAEWIEQIPQPFFVMYSELCVYFHSVFQIFLQHINNHESEFQSRQCSEILFLCLVSWRMLRSNYVLMHWISYGRKKGETKQLFSNLCFNLAKKLLTLSNRIPKQ